MNAQEPSTLERVRTILTKDFEVAPDLVQPEARLDQLAIDSLAVIEVMFEIEDEFGISFPQEPAQLQTVGELVDCIDRLVAQKP